MQKLVTSLKARSTGMLGTWVKIPALETVEMLARAGFDFVVIDMEHAPHSLSEMYRFVVAAQTLGMFAVVRMSDPESPDAQRILDAGADGVLIPRVASPAIAAALTEKMVFSPRGKRGLGLTSRAGGWGTVSMPEYVARGDDECLRMPQLEDWEALNEVEAFAALDHVNGLFVGLGDLQLSSGRSPSDPQVQDVVKNVVAVCKKAGVFSGIAAGSPEEGRRYLDLGYSLVMVSNDASIFARAASDMVKRTLAD